MSRKPRLRFAIPVALALMAGVAFAASPEGRAPLSLPEAQARFDVGTLRVERFGERGRALILIPGLASGGWVWAGTVRHFMSSHELYALTLAGFDGVPAPRRKTGLIDQADASLLRLIRGHHIERPVLVGHGLGGTLALRFAAEHPKLVSGVVSLDGLPVFPLMSAVQRRAAARQVREQAKRLTHVEFMRQQMRYMQSVGVIDPELARRCAELSARSDPGAVSEYTAENFELDVRPELKTLTAPVLVISPYYKPDFEHYAQLNNRPVTTQAQKADYYRALLKNAPHAKVITIEGARHFAMLDQPARFYAELAGFIKALPDRRAHAASAGGKRGGRS